ncbi:MAG: metallophosphoesterase [Clostridiales bacterium]
MKFLFFTDTHIRGTSPRNRKDNYIETLKLKFMEIKDISDRENVDYILNGGDWFDRPDIAPSIVRDFAKIIKSFNKKIYTVAGNHDLFGHNPDTFERTMLGILEGIDLLHLLRNENNVILEKDNIKVQLNGSSYKYDIDSENFEKYYMIKKLNNVDYTLNIVHGMLLKKPFFEGIQYTLLDDILNTEADITFTGHYHNGFGIEFLNNKYFINPGSIVRITNTINEIKRKPKVIILELNHTINVREIELKTALDGNDVLERTLIEDNETKNKKLNDFYKTVLNTGIYKKININEILDNIAYNKNIDKKVKSEIIKRIGLANEEINQGDEDN